MAKSDKLEEEKLKVAILRGARILIENGLGEWKIKLNSKRTSLAETFHDDKTIVFSKHFITIADKEQFEGVTLHEVTHALLGKGFGHGPKFVELCTKLSPTNEYARRSVSVPIGRYMMTCPECGYAGSSNSKKVNFCGKCFQENKMIKFIAAENKLKVAVW